MSKLTANLSTEDRKMLNKIFLRSFTVFASCAGGSVKQGAGQSREARQRHVPPYHVVQHYPERWHLCDGLGRFDGEGKLPTRGL